MAKFALLIGVSEYLPGLPSLPSALHDIEALKAVLADEAIAAFDEVKVLPNPHPQAMRVAIYHLFANRAKDDVVLLYFSGHGVRDRALKLFFATPETEKTERSIVPPTAVAASYLQEQMGACKSDRAVLILDCCYSGAFPKDLKIKGDAHRVDVEVQLGGRGRAILTSSTATQASVAMREAAESDERPLSLYTHYLVEGLKTGAADLDENGQITAYELHQYTYQKVTDESPAMNPEFYPVREGHEIHLGTVKK